MLCPKTAIFSPLDLEKSAVFCVYSNSNSACQNILTDHLYMKNIDNELRLDRIQYIFMKIYWCPQI